MFLVVGYGEDASRLKKLAGEDLGRGIRFLGRVFFERAISLTKAFDIYVHPSFPGGGLATSLLQAMAAGLPIVATPYEGAREVIFHRQTGYLVSESDPSRIAEGILYMVENLDEAQRMGERARELVERRFTWPRQIEQFKRLLEERGFLGCAE